MPIRSGGTGRGFRPVRALARGKLPDPVEQVGRGVRDNEGGELCVVEESLIGGVAEEGEQRVVKAVHVEEGAGFGMQAELGPGEDFEDFLEGADATGQGGEAIGQFGHAMFAIVHGGDGFQPGERRVADFLSGELFGDHADHLTADPQGGVGERAHQADVAAAVDQGDVCGGEEPAEFPRGVEVGGGNAGAGPAIDAE